MASVMYFTLQAQESQKTLIYFDNMYNLIPRSYMTMIDTHMYRVGQCKVSEANDEQAALLSHTGTIEKFYRLMKHGVLYYSRAYGTDGKRDNTYCNFEIDGVKHFGQIDLFVHRPFPYALVKKLQATMDSISIQAGHPCRPSLASYQETNILKPYIIPVCLSHSNQLLAVPLKSINSKVVHIKVENKHYCVTQPNVVEYH